MDGVWTSIAYHTRKGRLEDHNEPSRPTIIVFCHSGSSCEFQKVEGQLMTILEAIPILVHLEFLPGRITLFAPSEDTKARVVTSIPEKPLNGSSISTRGNTTNAGSLGGWVMLNLNPKHMVPCFLTCYHVVRSADNDVGDILMQMVFCPVILEERRWWSTPRPMTLITHWRSSPQR